MEALDTYVTEYGIWLVILNVFVVQIGVPVPAMPTLIVAGALSARGELSGPLVFVAAVAAALVADWIWYELGRRRGRSILAAMCRFSLSPDGCIRQTDAIFARFGMSALVGSKFVTGLSTIAPPLIGVMGVARRRFLAWDLLGCIVWAGGAIGVGLVFHGAIETALEYLAQFGRGALYFAIGALALVVTVKWWQRRRFFAALRMARISPPELRELLRREPKPIVVDVRGAAGRLADPRRIPGAMVLEMERIGAGAADTLPRGGEIVLYCT